MPDNFAETIKTKMLNFLCPIVYNKRTGFCQFLSIKEAVNYVEVTKKMSWPQLMVYVGSVNQNVKQKKARKA